MSAASADLLVHHFEQVGDDAVAKIDHTAGCYRNRKHEVLKQQQHDQQQLTNNDLPSNSDKTIDALVDSAMYDIGDAGGVTTAPSVDQSTYHLHQQDHHALHERYAQAAAQNKLLRDRVKALRMELRNVGIPPKVFKRDKLDRTTLQTVLRQRQLTIQRRGGVEKEPNTTRCTDDGTAEREMFGDESQEGGGGTSKEVGSQTSKTMVNLIKSHYPLKPSSMTYPPLTTTQLKERAVVGVDAFRFSVEGVFPTTVQVGRRGITTNSGKDKISYEVIERIELGQAGNALLDILKVLGHHHGGDLHHDPEGEGVSGYRQSAMHQSPFIINGNNPDDGRAMHLQQRETPPIIDLSSPKKCSQYYYRTLTIHIVSNRNNSNNNDADFPRGNSNASSAQVFIIPSCSDYNAIVSSLQGLDPNFNVDFTNKVAFKEYVDNSEVLRTQLSPEEVAFCEHKHITPPKFLTIKKRLFFDGAPPIVSPTDILAVCDMPMFQLRWVLEFFELQRKVSLHVLYKPIM